LGKSHFGGTPKDFEAMTKPELGTKRLCAHCGAKFYDLNHAPIACPKCGTVFEAVQVSSRWRAEAARPPVREVEPVVAETQEDQFVPLEDADAEAQGEPSGAPEAEDEASPMTRASTMPRSSKRARKRTPTSPRSSAAISRTRKRLEVAGDM
jgi:uncharacterized protein (TIGR02300 family)